MDGPLFDNSSLPPELEDRVRSELQAGEMLLWVGQPRPSRFARIAMPIFLFGVVWTAFALLWIAIASWIVFGGKAKPGGAFEGLPGFFLYSVYHLY